MENDHNTLVDQEMMDEWVQEVSRLWVAFQKRPSAEELNLYCDELAMIPLGLLRKTISRAIRDHKYSGVPNLHDVWSALRTELGGVLDIKQSIADWIDRGWDRVVVRFHGERELVQ